MRSMAVLIQAGPGGGVDVPAVKAVLHAQALERCVFMRRVEFDVPLPAPRARKHRRNVGGYVGT